MMLVMDLHSPASTDGRTISYWQATEKPQHRDPLQQPLDTDIVVIGAGIAGLTAAYLLLKDGRQVVVLDDSDIGDGQTGRTSAHLASAIDDRFYQIARMHGDHAARIQYESHTAAIDKIEEIAQTEGIDCDFARLDGYLFLAPETKPEELEVEFDAARRIGVPVERVPKAPLRGFDTGVALKFPNQGRFHATKYLLGLAAAVERLGGKIHCHSHVNSAAGANPAEDELCKVTLTDGPVVTGRAVVVATNTPAPINDWTGIYTKQASYRTYCVAMTIPKGSVEDELYWDTLDAYHYVRLQPGETDDLLIIGGEDHKTGQLHPDHKPFEQLEKWAREHFPQVTRTVYRWSGQVQEPVDGVAYIGAAPTKGSNVYVITGDSGMGLTHSTLGAILVNDLIAGRENPWKNVYDPSRKATHAPVEFVKENINVAAELAKDYIKPGEVAKDEDVPAGEGALVRHGLKKLAVYRDDAGTVHRRSSVCTHLGCVVHWNPIEKTWDCPCHGSRFACTGEPVMGPAVEGLKPAE
jgi:glycine/D-amino acid oxidase-like deaminating enzyme/nitrite reductase/ring-hydroxylating ferredoxin subunit